MFIKTKLHTIFLLIGPEKSGKTTFVKRQLIPELEKNFIQSKHKVNISYISSKDIRAELLGDKNQYDEHSLNECSELAFELLFLKLKSLTTFPVNSDFIILDTSGMSEIFRNRVIQISKDNQYNLESIVFDFKNKDEYMQRNKKILFSQYNKLRNEIYKDMKKEDYSFIHKIKSLKDDITVSVSNLPELENKILDNRKEYISIGDLHESVDELIELLKVNNFTLDSNDFIINNINERKIILVGDYVNKGSKILETINFIYKNRNHFHLLIGNHEDLLYKLSTEQINSEILKLQSVSSFTESYEKLKNNTKEKEMFIDLIENYSNDFFVLPSTFNNRRIFFTHSPCKNKYLGKVDSTSIKEQKHWSINNNEGFIEQLMYIFEEGNKDFSYHIFGHIAVPKIIQKNNKICIDTGCIHGNKLTSVSIQNNKPIFKSVNFLNKQATYNKELLNIEFSKRNKVELSEQEEKRLDYLLDNKINYISSTMSPADKDEEKGDLESIEKALDYFKSKKIKKVILEPKYMGNNSILYLDKDNIEECFLSSRNGFKISLNNKEELNKLFSRKIKEYNKIFIEFNAQKIVIAGELMPWSSIAEGLISKKFKVIGKALKSEFDILKNTGFEHSLSLFEKKYKETEFEKNFQRLNKKDIMEKYGISDYSNLREYFYYKKNEVPIEQHIKGVEVYNEQIEIYGKEEELDFKAFNILKTIDKTHNETIVNTEHCKYFPMISKDNYLIVNLDDKNYLKHSLSYFNNITKNKKLEGIVIKPDVDIEGVLPAVKVRNPDYLTIIYGYDYKFHYKYRKLIANKNINKKVSISLKEHQLSKEMLNIPLNNISNSKIYKNIVSELIFETVKEKTLDPRL